MKREDKEGFFGRIKRKISDFFYNLTQPMYAKIYARKKGTLRAGKKRRNDAIFYSALMAFPILQFIIYYVVVNSNSFLMAFQKYDNTLGRYYFVGFDNISDQIKEFMAGGILQQAVVNSLKAYGLSLLLLPFSVLFPFYIYKKLPMGGFFKVILFLPHILSTLVLSLLYQFFVNSVLPTSLANFGIEIPPLMYGGNAFMTAWVFTALFGFTNVLMYNGAMTSISKSVVEYSRLDGCSLLQEFRYITLPMIMPTIVVYVISGISGIFSNQLNLHAYFSGDISHTVTVGYLIFARSTGTGLAAYPVPAATGLLCTVIVTPIVIILRKVAKKYTSVA